MENDFLKNLNGKIVIVGIGNPLRGDDGAGPALINLLDKSLSEERPALILIDGGDAPENHLGRILKENPDTVLVVDAADFRAEPGAVRIIQDKDIGAGGLTTHNASLKIILDLIKQETKASVLLLGIQPQNIRLGETLSDPVKNSLSELVELLVKGLPHA